MLDAEKWGRHVEREQGLGARVIASAHGPALAGSMIDEAFTLIRRAADLDPFRLSTQADLEAFRSGNQLALRCLSAPAVACTPVVGATSPRAA